MSYDINFEKDSFLFLIICLCVWQVCAGVHEGQKRLRATPIQVLGMELWSSRRTAGTLSHRAISPATLNYNFKKRSLGIVKVPLQEEGTGGTVLADKEPSGKYNNAIYLIQQVVPSDEQLTQFLLLSGWSPSFIGSVTEPWLSHS